MTKEEYINERYKNDPALAEATIAFDKQRARHDTVARLIEAAQASFLAFDDLVAKEDHCPAGPLVDAVMAPLMVAKTLLDIADENDKIYEFLHQKRVEYNDKVENCVRILQNRPGESDDDDN